MDKAKIREAIELLDQADTLIQSAIPHNTEGVDSYGIYCDIQELISILEELVDEISNGATVAR